jgi:hypothetical protein
MTLSSANRDVLMMSRGLPLLMKSIKERVAEIIAVEAMFTLELVVAGVSYFFSGQIDCFARLKDGRTCVIDWKTGRNRPFETNFGYQLGLYALAVQHGQLVIGRSIRKLGLVPDCAAHVYVKDFVPYQKGGKKRCDTKALADHFGVEVGSYAQYTHGTTRGPGWYFTEDLPRLMRTVPERAAEAIEAYRATGPIRTVGDHCLKCPYIERCLNAAPENTELNAMIDRVTTQENKEK